MNFKLNEAKMFLDSAEDMTIVINFTSGGYYSFSSLGSLVVEKLARGVSTEDVLSSISVLPDCPESFKDDLDAFVQDLTGKEILLNVEKSSSPGIFKVNETALADGFGLKCLENTELQDLIMADPVHDVNPSAGWPFTK